jgi:hypothetical protein
LGKEFKNEIVMGIMKNGPHGPVYGRVGNLVTYRVLNKDVVRMVGKITKPPSVKQLACRQKMGVVIAFLRPLTDFISVGFALKARAANKYPYNMAVSYNVKFALAGEYPYVVMDYSKVMVANGNLPVAFNAEVSVIADGLRFNWDVGANMDIAERRHRTMLLVCFPLLRKAVRFIGGAERIAGTDVLYLPNDLRTAYMEIYISFICVSNNEVADSVYLGRLNS